MFEDAHPMNAADLLVHGTFAVRRSLNRLAHPVRRTVPMVAQPEPPGGRRSERERPAECVTPGRP